MNARDPHKSTYCSMQAQKGKSIAIYLFLLFFFGEIEQIQLTIEYSDELGKKKTRISGSIKKHFIQIYWSPMAWSEI